MTEADYAPEIPVNRAIWLAYVAKRRSERAPGVGKVTDVLVVDNEAGVRFLDDKTISAFEALYQKYLDSLRKASPNIDASIASYQLGYQRE